jgi:hypothetical protein
MKTRQLTFLSATGAVACLALTMMNGIARAEPSNAPVDRERKAAPTPEGWGHWQLVPSSDGRRIDKANGKEWFYMADTAWSLFLMLDQKDADTYLKNRSDKGFNVIQAVAVMGYNTPWNAGNAYGHRPFIDGDPTRPDTRTDANYWTHVDWVINRARKYGLYVMVTPCWGQSFVGPGKPLNTHDECRGYASFLANRYKDYPNIIWMNGGDCVPNAEGQKLLDTIGNTIKGTCKNHLMGFHGRDDMRFWFLNQDWCDFANNYSGHFMSWDKNYLKVLENWNHSPAKPIFDSEPCYEGLPKDIRYNPALGYFEARDTRRRAYWAVMTGAAGHAFGNNNVHLFAKKPFQGMKHYWNPDGMNQPAANQMGYLKNLMLSRSRKGLVSDQTLVQDQDPVYRKEGKKLNIELVSAIYGIKDDPKRQMDVKQQLQEQLDAHKYDCQMTNALAGRDPAYGVVKTLMLKYKLNGKEISKTINEFGYPFLANRPSPEYYRHIRACRTGTTAWYYIYTGRSFTAVLGKISGSSVSARWFNPRDGNYTAIGSIPNEGTNRFDPPGSESEGNDWVLELVSN